MLKIAITGNIASGKSTVEKIIENNGYKVYDTDKIAHKILENSEDVKKAFKTVDRKEIAKIVFSTPKKLKLLESIIHPKVKEEILKIFDSEDKLVFISVPQLFESGFDTLFNKIIYVTADRALRLERLIKRNNLTIEEAEIRINAQVEKDKIKKSDYIIENNTDLVNLQNKVKEVLELILLN